MVKIHGGNMSAQLTKIDSSLVSAISKTMESMTFEEVQVVSAPPGMDTVLKNKVWAVLPIISPIEGKISMELPFDYGRILTDEVCGGTEEEPSEDAIKDVVGEILNTMAGRFLDDLLDSEKSFELGLPESGRADLPVSDDAVAVVHVEISGHVIRTKLVGEGFTVFSKELEKELTT